MPSSSSYGDVHRIGGARRHSATSSSVEPGAGDQRVRASAGSVRPSIAHDVGREAQREPRHHVGVEVVVDDSRVLVGPGDAVDVERGGSAWS